MTRLFFLLLLLSMGLVACGTASMPDEGDDLPLAVDAPTFLFFYTDN